MDYDKEEDRPASQKEDGIVSFDDESLEVNKARIVLGIYVRDIYEIK